MPEFSIFGKTISLAVQGRPPKGELGATGTEVTADAGALGVAYLTEQDYNLELRGAALFKELDRMRLSDSQVKAVLSVLKLPLLAASWHFEPVDESSEQVEIATWLTNQFTENMTTSWQSTLRQMLLSLDFGVMPFEKVWEIIDDEELNRPMVHLRKLAPRLPKTILQWRVDEHGGLAGVIQQTMTPKGTMEEIAIPVEKLLVFVHEQEGSNYQGVSVLRQARKDWFIKERLQRINTVMLEKRSAGIDVVKLGQGATPADKTAAESAVRTIRTHERAYMVETDSVEYRVEGLGQGGIVDPLPSIEYHDFMILRGILAEFLGMGAGDSGSLAMHKDKSSFFLMALEAIAKDITWVINKHLVPQWVEYNWGPMPKYPKFVHSRLDRRDVGLVAQSLAQLATGGYITPTDDVEDTLRELLDLPEIAEEDRTPVQQPFNPLPNTPEEDQENPALPNGRPPTRGMNPETRNSNAQKWYRLRKQRTLVK